MAAYCQVYNYACVSLWAWWEVVVAHHWVHDYACCHLQADCQVRDQLRSQTLDLQVWDLPYTTVNTHVPFKLYIL